MDILFQFLEQSLPVLAGILTVPILQALKKASSFVDGTAPIVKQILGVVIAFILVKVGAFLNVVIPGELELFTASDVEAAVAAGIAFAIHAGKKASQKDAGGAA